jgi:O-antigen ligase
LTIGRTATRAAIPALIAMVAVYFFRGSGGRKLGILACSVIVAVVGVFALPEAAVERLSTIVDAVAGPSSVTSSAAGRTEAEESTLERRELMRDAIETAITHPFAGVGAGLFTQYRRDNMLRQDGSQKPYLPAHNTYLEIASDSGIPGVIFYLIFLGSIYAGIRETRKLSASCATAQSDLIQSIALNVEAALVYFSVCAMFMTCDKHPHQFVVAGFSIAMLRMARALPVQAPAAATLKRQATPPLQYAGKRSGPVAAY